MKNKFLLLCGVAAISVASVANYVKAGAIEAPFDVKIKLMTLGVELDKVQDLNFGTIFINNLDAGKSITLNTDGTVEGELKHYGSQKVALFDADEIDYSYGVNKFALEISGAEELRTPSVGQEEGNLCGYVSDWEYEKYGVTESDPAYLGFKVGATFTLPDVEDWELDDIVEYVDCQATATATLIYTGGVANQNP